MGREEEREILSGSRPEHASDLERASGASGTDGSAVTEAPEPDRRWSGDDARPSAYAMGDPDALPTDVTESREYQDELAEVRREVKAGEAVVEDGQSQMPPTRYDRS